MKPYKINAKVQWKWLGGVIEGHVVEVYFKPVEKMIKGKKIKRNGSKEKPAYLVQSKAGNFALKLHTELEAINHRRRPGFDIDRLANESD